MEPKQTKRAVSIPGRVQRQTSLRQIMWIAIRKSSAQGNYAG